MPRTSIRLPARMLSVGAIAALLLPATAMAATSSTSTVSGLVGSELSVSVSTPPPAMALTHAVNGTTTAALTIVSTTPWTLKVSDAGATTPGYLDKVNCMTSAALTGSLVNALQWANTADGTKSGALSATAATVATGTLGGAVSVLFTQTLGASEALTSGDCYQLTATWTVS
jgi:hypothetical protein